MAPAVGVRAFDSAPPRLVSLVVEAELGDPTVSANLAEEALEAAIQRKTARLLGRIKPADSLLGISLSLIVPVVPDSLNLRRCLALQLHFVDARVLGSYLDLFEASEL